MSPHERKKAETDEITQTHASSLERQRVERGLNGPASGRLTLSQLALAGVAVGDKVEPGQPVAVMEAMKMENILRAPKAADGQGDPGESGRQSSRSIRSSWSLSEAH